VAPHKIIVNGELNIFIFWKIRMAFKTFYIVFQLGKYWQNVKMIYHLFTFGTIMIMAWTEITAFDLMITFHFLISFWWWFMYVIFLYIAFISPLFLPHYPCTFGTDHIGIIVYEVKCSPPVTIFARYIMAKTKIAAFKFTHLCKMNLFPIAYIPPIRVLYPINSTK
jgi:hypothetical protein